MVSVWADLREDLTRDRCTAMNVIPRFLLAPRCQALVLFRLSQLPSRALAAIARRVNYTRNGCDIAIDVKIGGGLQLPHPVGVVIGPGVVIGRRCTIRQHATLGRGGSGDPTVGDDVTIGIGAVIFGAVTIGDRAQIAAYAVVRDDVPSGVLVAGAPAVIKGRNRAFAD